MAEGRWYFYTLSLVQRHFSDKKGERVGLQRRRKGFRRDSVGGKEVVLMSQLMSGPPTDVSERVSL